MKKTIRSVTRSLGKVSKTVWSNCCAKSSLKISASSAQSGFAPVSLETGVTARLPADWPEPLNGLAIRGRMDRIDRNDSASAGDRL